MTNKVVVARNVLWNGAGLAIPLVAGFLLAPFFIHYLGEERNGLWVLILLWMDSFNLLDLGISGSVGRNIAYHRARGEAQQASAVLSTSLAMLCSVGMLVVVLTFLAPLLFFRCNQVPAADASAVSLALVIIGTSVALSLPLSVFDGSLWALQRFDLTNAIDIPTALVRTGLTFALVWWGHGLVSLALLALVSRGGAGALKWWFSFRLAPDLVLRWRLVSRAAARGLIGYSIWSFVLSVTRMAAERIAPQVISARLGVALVTPQSVAAKLVGYSNALMIAGTEVLTPVATRHHAQEDHGKQQGLFLAGGKYCLALSIYFVSFFVCLGPSFLTLWVGPKIAQAAYPLLVVLMLGEMLPMSQWISCSTALAMSRHRALAILCVLEIIVAIIAALWLVDEFGTLGACLGVAVPAALFRGLGQWLFACRLVSVSYSRYLARAVVPAVAAAGLPVVGLWFLCAWKPPSGWGLFLTFAALHSITFAVLCGLGLVGYRSLRQHGLDVLRGLLGRDTASPQDTVSRLDIPPSPMLPNLAGACKLRLKVGSTMRSNIPSLGHLNGSARRRRIAHVTLGLETGGQEKLLVEFARHADRQHFDLVFLSLTSRGQLAADIEEQGWPVAVLGKPLGFRPRFVFDLVPWLRRSRIDAVHTHDATPLIYGALAARLAGVPRVIHTRHFARLPIITRRQAFLGRLAARLTDAFVCVSEDSARVAIEEGVPFQRVGTVWNGIDMKRFAFAGPRPDGPAVLVARLSPEKDVVTLLRAVALVVREKPSFRLEIAGNGPCLPDLLQQGRNLRLESNVVFVGEVRDVPRWLARASLFVLPSLTEGISLTLLEAMSCGLPVVATRVGGNPEVVANNLTGLLVPPGEPTALARAMLQVHGDGERSQRMGEAGRRRVQQYFEARRMVAAYESLYMGHSLTSPGKVSG
jgi:glycosyltransferase involved in cell wall biosynthesis/O-antigen/teichoic acid export membrane protein